MFQLVQKVIKNRPRNVRVIIENKVARFFVAHSVHGGAIELHGK